MTPALAGLLLRLVFSVNGRAELERTSALQRIRNVTSVDLPETSVDTQNRPLMDT
jgi:hypothetical protein